MALLGKKTLKAGQRRRRGLRRAALIIGLFLILGLALRAILFPPYAPLPPSGPCQVKTSVRQFTDTGRAETYGRQGGARTLTAAFWYPEQAAGPFPLIVFSPGAFGTRDSNETLCQELASQGYVVCAIDHTYQCLYTRGKNGELLLIDSGYLDELRRENAKADKENSLALYEKWLGIRVADINFVLDAILEQARQNPAEAPFSLTDSQNIGLIGHSLGGSAMLGAGRLRSDIKAVIALESPFLWDIRAVENGAFVFESAPYPVPLLNIYTDSSWSQLAEWPQYAQNARLLADPDQDQDAYNLYLAGAGHLSLTDLALASPVLTRLLNGHASSAGPADYLTRLNENCLGFFNCFLKDGPRFAAI